MALACTLLVGNPKPDSRTLAVASTVTGRLTGALAGCGVAVDPVRLVDLSGAGQASSADVLAADLLVVASPTFKATYSGLLKVFLDQLRPRAFAGITAVGVMTAGNPGHRGAVETCLRPLLLELGARLPVPGLCVLESEFAEVDRVAAAWCADSAPVLAAVAERFAVSLEGGARWMSRPGLTT